ncbi:MAG: methyltransferase domain-containing protein [Syntrophales bacterium]|jgi:ubiquinone/menaquinone biosynthesis C-methylase UbiE
MKQTVVFDESITRSYDQWYETPAGRYMDARERSLILELAEPRAGERVLDVGCGTGSHMLLFKQKGCLVTGLDPSTFMLDLAREKLGSHADLRMGIAEDLPFSDNEFDIVTLITSLEFVQDPEKAICEAIRVCRGRVFIGVLNKLSLIGIQRRIRGMFRPSIYNKARFFQVGTLTNIIRRQLQGVHVQWGSVLFLPEGRYGRVSRLEEIIPVMKNPFGAFIGISFPVTFTYRVVQDVIRDPLAVNANHRQPAPGAVRGMHERS